MSFNFTITAELVAIVNAIATVVTSILTGIYIFYTRRTFIEIRKQTDNQVRAYLLVVSKFAKEQTGEDHLLEVRKQWDQVISKILPEQPPNSQCLVLELKNRGKTDICWWKILVRVNVEVGGYLAEMHIEKGENQFEIEYSDSTQIIQPEASVTVPFGQLGLLPKATFKWAIVYRDLHDNLYTESSGDSSKEYVNKLLFEYRK